MVKNYWFIRFSQGANYYERNEYEQAIQEFDESIKLKSDYSDAYLFRGWAYYFLKQYERALQDFDKAIELDPKVFRYYEGRGKTYYKAKAQADYAKAKELGYKG